MIIIYFKIVLGVFLIINELIMYEEVYVKKVNLKKIKFIDNCIIKELKEY